MHAIPADHIRSEDFMAFMESSPAAAYVRDPEGLYLWVNARYAQLHGHRDPAALLGRSVKDVAPPAIAAAYTAADRDVLWGRRPHYHRVLPSGHLGTVHRMLVRLPDNSAAVAGVYLHAVTPRTDDGPDVARTALDLVGVPVGVATREGVLRYGNRDLGALLGNRSLRGTHARDLLTEDDCSRLAFAVRALLKRRSARVTTKLTAVGTNSLSVHVRLSLSAGAEELVVGACRVFPAVENVSRGAFSPFEVEILAMMARGLDNREIAAALFISRQGLDYHLRRLREAFGARGRADLVAKAIVMGTLDSHWWPPRPSA